MVDPISELVVAIGESVTKDSEFLNKEGLMSWKGKSSEANDEDTINEQWAIANE